jgi:putative heme-binding domain-containing protein
MAADAAGVLLARVRNASAKSEERIAAAEEILGYQGDDIEVVKTLLDQVTPKAPPEIAIGTLRALRASEVPETPNLILERLPGLTPECRTAGIGVLLTRPEWTLRLIKAIEQNEISLNDLQLDQKQGLAQHPNAAVRKAALALLKRGGALASPDRQRVIDEFNNVTKSKGDAAAGKKVFLAQCAKCHRHSGEGQNIGPDLTGVAVHPKEHLLIDILDPSRSVEGNFRVYQVTKVDGKVVQGMLAAESKTAVELIDAEGKRQMVLRENIEELVGSNKSLMPEGFEKQVSVKELTDLLEFLTQKGKYIPLPLDKIASAVSTRGMFYDEANRGERLVLPDWQPKTVESVPFVVVDPQGDTTKNVLLLYGPEGKLPPRMPKSASMVCNTPARAIHILGGISGWGFPFSREPSVSVVVRLHYANGKTEDHELKNGNQLADYIRRVDVPGSLFAFAAEGGQQVRYLVIRPEAKDLIERIEFVKGPDGTAPVIVAVTLELPE